MYKIKFLDGSVREFKSLRGADLRDANLVGADLRYADLRNADLRGADLRFADLSGADLKSTKISRVAGNMKQIKSMHLGTWHVTYTKDQLAIGCEQYSIEDWFSFDDEVIQAMDERALEWWHNNREFIRTVLNNFPAG